MMQQHLGHCAVFYTLDRAMRYVDAGNQDKCIELLYRMASFHGITIEEVSVMFDCFFEQYAGNPLTFKTYWDAQ